MRKIYLSILFIIFTITITAQEPEKTFVPYYIVDGQISEFEKAGAKIEAKSIGFGYGGVNSYYTIFKSKNSTVQFKSTEIPKFIIKTDANTETFELVIVTKADVVKKKKTYRRFVIRGNAIGGAKDFSDIKFTPTLKKISDNLYEIVFNKPLVPGEYSFSPIYKGLQAGNIMTSTGKTILYCFGVID